MALALPEWPQSSFVPTNSGRKIGVQSALSSGLPIREPHPIRDFRRALENNRLVCGVRGYCGPFLNEAFYNAFPDPMWAGYGECLVCCSTCLVEDEEKKRKGRSAASTACDTPISHGR